MKSYLDKAFTALNKITIAESRKSEIIKLAEELMSREH
jgi:geranylgeranyl diphosphate synthase type II